MGKSVIHQPQKIKADFEQYLAKKEHFFYRFASDTILVEKFINNTIDPEIKSQYFDQNVGLFIYSVDSVQNNNVVFWTSNKMLPEAADLLKNDGNYLVTHQNGNFEFLKKTYFHNGKKFILAALVPVYWKYFLSNAYLSPNFPPLEDLEKYYEFSTVPGAIVINDSHNHFLFGLTKKDVTKDPGPGIISLTLRIASILILLVLLNSLSFYIAHKQGWRQGFLLLGGSLLVARFLSYIISFPLNLKGVGLFDNLIYASNYLHPTLGDLLINVLLAFWLVSFLKFTALKKVVNEKRYVGVKAIWVLLFLSALLILFAFVSAGITRSLIKDSSISFDVTNFFSLNIYTLISFIILCFIILTFFHFSHIVLLFIYNAVDLPDYSRYFSVGLTGLLYLSLPINSTATFSNSVVLIWLLLFMLLMEFRKQDIFLPLFRSAFFLVWLMFFAASISALIIYQNKVKDIETAKNTTERLAWEADPTIQNIMSAGMVDIDSSFLSSNFSRFLNYAGNKQIKDSLTNQYFASTFDKYQTRLYAFDSQFRPLFNEDSATYPELINVIETRSKKTFHPDLFYFQKEVGLFSFLYRKLISDKYGKILGSFFIVVEPQKYKGETILPELLKTDAGSQSDLELTYAIYENGQLVKSNGDFNFSSQLGTVTDVQKEFYVIDKSDYREFWYNAGENKKVLMIERGTVSVEFITLFAYLFGAFLFIVIIIQAGHILFIARFKASALKQIIRPNLKGQIQSTISFISVFSFVVIGVATITFYISRFNQNNRERLVKTIKIMGYEIERQVYKQASLLDASKLVDDKANKILQSAMQEISEVQSVDANLYDLEGKLHATTQPEMYNKKIFSYIMEPKAYERLHFIKEIQYIQQEKVNNFSFLSIYIPLNDGHGKPYAYLNIPYLNTQRELNQEISNFLVTLISLNAFIFVIAGVIAILLTNKITSSFRLIAEKMKRVNLGQANEEIEWSGDNEIGALVIEYNKMVRKLDNSARVLAKSEREGAWREMAKQVAHEIKNPLTPMKLSIQYLQKAIREKNPDMQALSQKVAATLVEQIDQLAKIASDFSQFAQIGTIHNESFDINEVISSLVNMYSSNEKLMVDFIHGKEKVMIYADRTQINRLFTNLLQNAVEASHSYDVNKIIINEEIDENEIMISITDFGTGIPQERYSKIFMPNFTTKSSGTGLGLAMCKGIVEKANGRIWFESVEGEGTTFFVLLPSVNMHQRM